MVISGHFGSGRRAGMIVEGVELDRAGHSPASGPILSGPLLGDEETAFLEQIQQLLRLHVPLAPFSADVLRPAVAVICVSLLPCAFLKRYLSSLTAVVVLCKVSVVH